MNPYEPPAAEDTRRQWSPMTEGEQFAAFISVLCICVNLMTSCGLAMLNYLANRQHHIEGIAFAFCFMTFIGSIPGTVATLRWALRNLR